MLYNRSHALICEIHETKKIWTIHSQILEMDGVKEIQYEKDHGEWIEKHELIDGSQHGSEDFVMKSAYSKYDGGYIGNVEDADYFVNQRGLIDIQKINPNHNVCCIGFCPKDNKWYGWSHRAIHGFGPGSTTKMGDCGFVPSNKDEFVKSMTDFWKIGNQKRLRIYHDVTDSKEDIPGKGILITYTIIRKDGSLLDVDHFCPYPKEWGNGEWIAKDMEDAKQMAIDFANGVS